MSMNLHVVGIRTPTEEYRRMVAAYDACHSAGVNPPQQILDYFGHEPPNAGGMLVDLNRKARKHSADSETGIEIDLTDVPKDVTKLRLIVRF